MSINEDIWHSILSCSQNNYGVSESYFHFFIAWSIDVAMWIVLQHNTEVNHGIVDMYHLILARSVETVVFTIKRAVVTTTVGIAHGPIIRTCKVGEKQRWFYRDFPVEPTVLSYDINISLVKTRLNLGITIISSKSNHECYSEDFKGSKISFELAFVLI